MGWSKFAAWARWAVAPSLGLPWLGCGGADAASGPVTPNGGGASRAGAGATAGANAAATAGTSAAATAGTSAAATAGAGAAAMAGHDSGGAAASGGSETIVEGGSSGMAGAGPASENWFVDELRGREGCLPRTLPVVTDTGGGLEAGQVLCSITLVTVPAAGAACVCDAGQNLTSTSASLARAVAVRAEQDGACGGNSGVACQDLCQCDLEQASGAALSQCQTDIRTPIAELPPGFCYVDLDLTPSLITAAVVGACPQNSQRVLRVLGPAPDPAPPMYLSCHTQ